MKWNVFTQYKTEMFKKTSTIKSPWIVIKGNDKDADRKEAMRYALNSMDYPEKGDTGERLVPDSEIVSSIYNE